MCLNVIYNKVRLINYLQSHWPRDLRRCSAAASLMVFRVRIPPGSMSVSSEWCMLSGRGPYDGMITGPEEPYRMFCVWVWSWSLDHEGGPEPRGAVGSWKEKNINICPINLHFKTVANEETHHSTLSSFAIVYVCRRVQKKWKRWNFIWHFI